ncbi:hypothetical protein HC928_15000 [bacterium]|nr:hypothetical protein [bacterium]
MGAFGASWWGYSEFNHELVEIVSGTSQPLIVAECSQCSLYEKFYYPMTFDSGTHVLILEETESFYLPDGFENVFLFAPSDRLLSEVSERGVKSELVYQFRDPTTNFELTLYQLNLAESLR